MASSEDDGELKRNLDEGLHEEEDKGERFESEGDHSEGDGSEDTDVDSDECELPFKSLLNMTAEEIRRLKFTSDVNAYNWYCAYAKGLGFVVRKDVRARDAYGKVIMRQFVCNREGLREKKYFIRDRQRDHRALTRTKCRAKLRIRYVYESSKWKVVSFVVDHNHELTPSKYVPVIDAYRTMTDADKAQVDSLHSSGVRTCHIMGYMAAQKGGFSGMNFLKEDLYNYVNRQRNQKLKGGDAKGALTFLRTKADTDPMFFSKYTTTEDNRMKNLLWADGVSRADFQCFGDVLAFDSTYGKTKYNQPLVIFSGCNHHSMTVIFACALVGDEKIDTYVWVLETFLEAMCGKHPKSVVTDGDPCMKEAIRQVFPNASHRLCAWHLFKNAQDHVKNKPFLDDFEKALYSHFTIDDFEEFWMEMVAKHGLQDDKWVKATYEKRTTWATAYLRDQFFAGIRTTSRCEAINARIKPYVNKRNSLVEFMHNIELALRGYRHNELAADYKSLYTEPVCLNQLYKFESDAAKVFTRKIFKEVRHQLECVAPLNFVDRTEDGDNVRFRLSKYSRPNRIVEVSFNTKDFQFSCQCRLFESRAIPCSHIFYALKHEDVEEIPTTLVANRWRKDAKAEFMSGTPSGEVEFEVMKTARFGALAAACNNLCVIGSENNSLFSQLRTDILKLTARYKKKMGCTVDTFVDGVDGIRDPNVVASKGAPAKKRARGRRTVRCSNCHRLGHTRTTCKKKVDTVEETGSEQECTEVDQSVSKYTERTSKRTNSVSKSLRRSNLKNPRPDSSTLKRADETENPTQASVSVQRAQCRNEERVLSPQHSTMEPETESNACTGRGHPASRVMPPPLLGTLPLNMTPFGIGNFMPAHTNFPQVFGQWIPRPQNNMTYGYGNQPHCMPMQPYYGILPVMPQNPQIRTACQGGQAGGGFNHSQHEVAKKAPSKKRDK